MKDLKHLCIVAKTRTQDKLDSLNRVNSAIADPQVHRMWCGGEVPFGSRLANFESGTEPLICWTAEDEHGIQVGHAELHHNQFGWVLARLWVDEQWRRVGLARKLWLKALDHAFQHTNHAGCFCDFKNLASKRLQLSMGFKVRRQWPEANLEFLSIDRTTYLRLKRSGRGKISLAFAQVKSLPRHSQTQG